MASTREALVIGAGIFGVSTALSLREQGWQVTLCDQGPIPHPAASSTDLSKIVRPDYGTDQLYTEMAVASLERWQRWNRHFGQTLYHATGFLLLTRNRMAEGSFEAQSLATLSGMAGLSGLTRLDTTAIATRYPQFRAGSYADGYLNPHAGWASAGEAVRLLAGEARRRGVRVLENLPVRSLLPARMKRPGVILLGTGEHLHADAIVIAGGAWSAALLPDLAAMMRPVAQYVVHLAPKSPAAYTDMPVWAADITQSGWYGFPLTEGVVKVAHHGPGVPNDPRVACSVPPEHLARLRGFLAESLPGLADAEVAATRVCHYMDSWDGHFYLDEVPGRRGVFVATGGSGHAYKFGPVLGEIMATVVEGKPHPWRERFRWRQAGQPSHDVARAEIK